MNLTLRVLHDLELFYCERLACHLRAEACARRHHVATLSETHHLHAVGAMDQGFALEAASHCVGCPIGEANLAQHPDQRKATRRAVKRAKQAPIRLTIRPGDRFGIFEVKAVTPQRVQARCSLCGSYSWRSRGQLRADSQSAKNCKHCMYDPRFRQEAG